MASLSLKQSLGLKLSAQHRLAHRVKLANFIELPESSFSSLVQQIEKDPLFQHYKNVANEERLFSYQRYPRTGISTGFLEINENVIATPSGGITQEYLQDKKDIVDLCQKIGMDNFQKNFLYNEENHSPQQISSDCGLTLENTLKIMDLVNRLALDEEFQTEGKGTDAGTHQNYSKIANIEKDATGEFSVIYTSLRYGRGRYLIDREKFEALKKSSHSSKEEIQHLENMIKTLELINTRKSIIFQTLEKIMERQRPFLLTKDPGQLNSMTQLEMGREMDIHSSSISRAIFGKSVGMPWGEEIPLKFFFVRGPINKIKSAIYLLIDEEEKQIRKGKLQLPYRDDEIKNLIKIENQIEIAVRTIAKYRSELGIKNVYDRLISYKTNAGNKSKTKDNLFN